MNLPPPDTRVYNNHVLFLLILWVKSLSRTRLCSAGHSAEQKGPGRVHSCLALQHCSLGLLVPWCFIACGPAPAALQLGGKIPQQRGSRVPEAHFCHSWWLEQLQSLPRSSGDRAGQRLDPASSGTLAREETVWWLSLRMIQRPDSSIGTS